MITSCWCMTRPLQLFGTSLQQSRSCPLAASLDFHPSLHLRHSAGSLRTSSSPHEAYKAFSLLRILCKVWWAQMPLYHLSSLLPSPTYHVCVLFVQVSNRKLWLLSRVTGYSSLWLGRLASTSQCHSSFWSFFPHLPVFSLLSIRVGPGMRLEMIKSTPGAPFLISLSPFLPAPQIRKSECHTFSFLCVSVASLGQVSAIISTLTWEVRLIQAILALGTESSHL